MVRQARWHKFNEYIVHMNAKYKNDEDEMMFTYENINAEFFLVIVLLVGIHVYEKMVGNPCCDVIS